MAIKEEILVEAIFVDKNATNKIKSFTNSIGKIKNTVKYASDSFSIMGDRINNVKMRFQGWALSIMFFGMALQRTFTQILKEATSTFTKILEASEIQGSAIQKLGLWWEYLKFEIGNALNSALAPLLPMIINIISNIAQWIEEHPRLVAWLIILGLVLGFILFLIGFLVLAIVGLITMFIILGIIIAVVGWPFIIAVLIIIALAILLIIFWDKVKAFFIWLWEVIKQAAITAWNWIKETAMKVADWIKEKWNTIVEFFKNVWGILVDGFKTALNNIKEFFLGLWETIKQIFTWIIDKAKEVGDKIAAPFKAIGRFFGGKGGAVEGSRQFGGFVPKSGLYRLHAGESVVPSNNTFGNITINVSGIATSDPRRLAEIISAELMKEIARRAPTKVI